MPSMVVGCSFHWPPGRPLGGSRSAFSRVIVTAERVPDSHTPTTSAMTVPSMERGRSSWRRERMAKAVPSRPLPLILGEQVHDLNPDRLRELPQHADAVVVGLVQEL